MTAGRLEHDLVDYLQDEIAGAPRFSKQRQDDVARLRLLAHGTKEERQAIFAGLAVRRLAPVVTRAWLPWRGGNQTRKGAGPVNQSPWGRAGRVDL